MYCAVASLYLMDETLACLSTQEKDDIMSWCLRRQVGPPRTPRLLRAPSLRRERWAAAGGRVPGSLQQRP
jgi:hypothetical protein